MMSNACGCPWCRDNFASFGSLGPYDLPEGWWCLGGGRYLVVRQI